MDLSQIFIHNMKKYRRIAGLSQQKLAENCDSSPAYIRQIECGARYPSFALIGRIAQALNVPPSNLFIDQSSEESLQTEHKRQIKAEVMEKLDFIMQEVLDKL